MVRFDLTDREWGLIAPLLRDCQEFRVRVGILGRKGVP